MISPSPLHTEGTFPICYPAHYFQPYDDPDVEGPISKRMARYVMACKGLIESDERIRCHQLPRDGIEVTYGDTTNTLLRFLRSELHDIMVEGHVMAWQYSPYAELLVRHGDSVNLFDSSHYDWDFKLMGGQEASQQVKLLNGVIDAIRAEGRGPVFRARIRAENRGVRERSRSVISLIESVFRHDRSKVLAVRVDLAFNHALQGGLDPLHDSFTYDEVCACREALGAYLDQEFGDSLRASMLRLEYGLDKGFHFHLLALFDGRKHRLGLLLAKMIGEHWKQVITALRGNYYNCHADEESYRSKGKLGIGMIRHHDYQGRLNLNTTALYLCKHDPYIWTHIPPGAITLWRSEDKPAREMGSGRPRVRPSARPLYQWQRRSTLVSGADAAVGGARKRRLRTFRHVYRGNKLVKGRGIRH